MGKNGDTLGDDTEFQLGGEVEDGGDIETWDPADFADDQSPTNPGRKQEGVPGTTRLKFKPTAPGERNRRRKKARKAKMGSIVDDNRKAVDPGEREENMAAWDNFGGRKLIKVDGVHPIVGETPLKESHRDSLVRKLIEARQHGRASSELLGLVAEIRRHDPDFDPEAALSPNEVAAQINEILGGETSSGPARLETDLASTADTPPAKLPPLKMSHGPSSAPGPVSFWKRRVAKAITALGLIGVVGGVYKVWEQLQPSLDETEDVAKLADPVAVGTPIYAPVSINEPTVEESAPAATLYDEVGNKLETKTEGTGLSQAEKARIHAASTNDLTESLYDGAKRWETLDGKWLDTPGAHANVVKKLTTWGGYKDVLTVSANANSIDEMLEDIASSDLPHSELVAWKVAVQIASIKEVEVVPSVEEVETRLDTVDSATIDQTLDENIENPPPVPGPSFFADQEASQTGSLDSSLYDAPEPPSFLAKAASVEIQTPTAVWVEEMEEVTATAPRFEDRFDAIEPSHVKPVVQTKAETPVVPVFMDPTEAAEPVALLAAREAEIPDVTEFLEEDPVPPPAPKPVPTLLENAKSAFSSLTSRFKSWLS